VAIVLIVVLGGIALAWAYLRRRLDEGAQVDERPLNFLSRRRKNNSSD